MIRVSIVAIMQILNLQWLLKGENKQERETNFNSSNNRRVINHDSNAKGKHVILHNKHRRGHRRRRVEASKLGCKNGKISAFTCTRDIAEAGFYSKIHLRSSERRPQFICSMKMKREETARGIGIKPINNKAADSAVAYEGSKVLPITEASILSAPGRTNRDQYENKDQNKGHKKNKPISRIKGLLRWVATAKSDRGWNFRGRKVPRQGTLEAVSDEVQVRKDSPKISFTWEVERCSTTTSPYSATSSARNEQSSPRAETEHIACREGYWITTDSEFVVLEL